MQELQSIKEQHRQAEENMPERANANRNANTNKQSPSALDTMEQQQRIEQQRMEQQRMEQQRMEQQRIEEHKRILEIQETAKKVLDNTNILDANSN